MRITEKPTRGPQSRGAEAGFTLIELSVVIAISSIILIGILQVYMVYTAQYERTRARDIVVGANEAIGDFFGEGNGRYPCPADPALPLTDVNAGVENCGLTSVSGARQTDGTLGLTPRPALDPVLVGGLPFKTLGVAQSDTVDPWGGKLLYAVSKAQTVKATFHDNFGAIRVETEAGQSLTEAQGSVHYVVFSTGKNRLGAYLGSGKRPKACGSGLAESKNCAMGSTYVQGLLNLSDTSGYFDDMLMYTSRSITRLWEFNTLSGGEVITYAVNTGNVGVGLIDPKTKLQVSGNIRTGRALQTQICDDSTPPRCWSPANFGSAAGTRCPTAPAGSVYVAQGIRNGQIACSTTLVGLPKPGGQQGCPTGQYVSGFSYTGAIICKNP